LPLFEGRYACAIGAGSLTATIQAAFADRGATLVQEVEAENEVWPDISSIIIDDMPRYEQTMSNLEVVWPGTPVWRPATSASNGRDHLAA
jgi:hypothetical protein